MLFLGQAMIPFAGWKGTEQHNATAERHLRIPMLARVRGM